MDLNAAAATAARLKTGDRIHCGAVAINICLLSRDPLCETVPPLTGILYDHAGHEPLRALKGFSEIVAVVRRRWTVVVVRMRRRSVRCYVNHVTTMWKQCYGVGAPCVACCSR